MHRPSEGRQHACTAPAFQTTPPPDGRCPRGRPLSSPRRPALLAGLLRHPYPRSSGPTSRGRRRMSQTLLRSLATPCRCPRWRGPTRPEKLTRPRLGRCNPRARLCPFRRYGCPRRRGRCSRRLGGRLLHSPQRRRVPVCTCPTPMVRSHSQGRQGGHQRGPTVAPRRTHPPHGQVEASSA